MILLKNMDQNLVFLKKLLIIFLLKIYVIGVKELGEKTFIGSSGRFFQRALKHHLLLRAWLARLKKQNVIFKTNHDWQGWENNNLIFNTKNGKFITKSDFTILSLGGASWPKLGSDGSWVKILEAQGCKGIYLTAFKLWFFRRMD